MCIKKLLRISKNKSDKKYDNTIVGILDDVLNSGCQDHEYEMKDTIRYIRAQAILQQNLDTISVIVPREQLNCIVKIRGKLKITSRGYGETPLYQLITISIKNKGV